MVEQEPENLESKNQSEEQPSQSEPQAEPADQGHVCSICRSPDHRGCGCEAKAKAEGEGIAKNIKEEKSRQEKIDAFIKEQLGTADALELAKMGFVAGKQFVDDLKVMKDSLLEIAAGVADLVELKKHAAFNSGGLDAQLSKINNSLQQLVELEKSRRNLLDEVANGG